MLLHVFTPCYVCFSRWFREECCLHSHVHSVSSRCTLGDPEELTNQKSPQPNSETSKMKAALSPKMWELTYFIRCKKNQKTIDWEIQKYLMWKKAKNMGHIHVTLWRFILRSSGSKHRTFLYRRSGDTMTTVSECVCWALKHATKTYVAITLKSAVRNKFHICRFAGRDAQSVLCV